MPNSELSAPLPQDYMYMARGGNVKDANGNYYNGWDNFGDFMLDILTGGAVSQMQNQQYQNAYNEYLYNKYQSPSALAEQYEAAGLNRNFAQQGPQGNIQPSASANMHNDALSNSLKVVQGVNALLSAVAQGVGITSDILSIPKDQAYKTWRNMIASQNADIASSRALSVLSKAYYDSMYYGGRKVSPWEMNGEKWDPLKSPAMTQAGLRNDVMELMKGIRKYDLNTMKPEQYNYLQKQIESLGTRIGIDQKTLEFFDANSFSRILAPFLMFLTKLM